MMLQICLPPPSNTLIHDGARSSGAESHAVYSMMVYGHGSIWSVPGRRISDQLGAPFTVAMGAVAAIGGAVIFGVNLSKIRVEARV